MLDDLLLPILRACSTAGYAAGLAVVSAVAAGVLVQRGLKVCNAAPGWAPLAWGLTAGALVAALTVAMLDGHCQETPDVRPSELWWRLRPASHALLIVLLVAATATDLRTCYILDSVTTTGMLAGLLLATLSGDLQIAHVWVDWNAEVPQLQGPYIPAWIADHPHLHGLTWSAAGLLLGGGVTWGARAAASRLLGQEALGFGDVTLMGMIGAFLGWQPTLLVFLLAPLCAVIVVPIVRLVSSRTYVPYGPFLSLAAVIVLFTWGRLWMLELSLTAAGPARGREGVFALRRLFGDWPGLLILAGMLAGGLVLLLGAWRLYQTLPTGSRHRSAPTSTDESSGPSDGIE